MSLRIMLVDEDDERGAVLQEALAEAGYRVVARLRNEENLAVAVREYKPDMVIIDMEAPGRDTLEQMREVSRDNPKPIVLFSNNRDSEYIRQAVRAGVSAYVVDGLSRDRILPIVEVAMARFSEFQVLRRELEDTRARLADRKLVEKAKGLLMKHRGLSEDEAYQSLRKTAMARNQRIVDVARMLLALEEFL
ncbi:MULTISPECIES: ANTAR domain-containing response regulator [Methylococcus]|uniref:Response regulator NasT n=2 Tax=Methylococcus capsulatus TaxID=414 RepID=Q60B92_METCA|nr:ANTAR domain-containing protein [Methylococcus capsulatus]AAU93173.1 response regulator NasT [Methylococcus capsulatus str. Bath]QXP88598.1 ANTAR domain-containing protein [Methylococcus capsulatus]QXP90037.1 ANTAR domain-containing protein [Methylococcus capsulatus]QXP94388.1 ANTAR domain-containing protein [Methylococcus capsulatus]UQN10872.1 ANTAR domain-containing protein [Methylococcus capsulatus]